MAQKVSQATIDSMKQMGMAKAIAKANSGSASPEFVEGAKRMYGSRVKTTATANVTTAAPTAPANAGGRVYGDKVTKRATNISTAVSMTKPAPKKAGGASKVASKARTKANVPRTVKGQREKRI